MSKCFLAPEWNPHIATLITWPHENSDWSTRIDQIDETYISIARNVVAFEPLWIICFDQQHIKHIKTKLTTSNVSLSKIVFFSVSTNDTWVRDYGPIIGVCDHKNIFFDFTFDGWGEKYDHALDNQVNKQLRNYIELKFLKYEKKDLILEGGNLEVNGQGSMLCSFSCYRRPTYDGAFSQRDLEQSFNKFFGITQMHWIDIEPLPGDDTDGHIDTLARFCDPSTIAYIHSEDPSHPSYEQLNILEQQLRSLRDAHGRPYKLIQLPMPQEQVAEERVLPTTYANFYIVNGAVLVPTYQDKMDDIALKQLKQVFPNRTTVGIDCCELVRQYGSLHCATMHIPKIQSHDHT